MSNALETKLREQINELQGLYKQCAADIAEIKKKISALEEKFNKFLETFYPLFKKQEREVKVPFPKEKILLENTENSIMSESSLKKDWLSAEEEEAWKNL